MPFTSLFKALRLVPLHTQYQCESDPRSTFSHLLCQGLSLLEIIINARIILTSASLCVKLLYKNVVITECAFFQPVLTRGHC